MSRYYRYIYTAVLVLSTLLSTGCRRGGEEPQPHVGSALTYLEVSVSGIRMPQGTTRAQGSDLSINTDAADREDYVNILAVLIYDATDGKLVSAKFARSPKFTIEAEINASRKYHVCFLANYSLSWENTLQGLRTYDDFLFTMKELRDFSNTPLNIQLFNGATDTSFLPMSRIYLNQTLPKGGSALAPLPFKPITNGNGDLHPVSNRTTDKETGDEQTTVNLIRTSAKVSVTIKVSDGKYSDINYVKLCNIQPAHSFAYIEKSTVSSDRELIFKNMGVEDFEKATSPVKSVMYIPENLLGVNTMQLHWDTTKDLPKGGINYIEISMKDGTYWRIPVITATSQDLLGKDYYRYARGGYSNKADYSTVRNHAYDFVINVPSLKADLDMTVHYQVKPWVVNNIDIEFE